MRAGIAVWLAGIVLASAQTVQSPAFREPPPFRSRIEVIGVTATVRDAAGRLAADLPREAFQIFDDGEPQTVTQFTRERVPISLGVLLDVSDSMYGQRIVEARAAVKRFLFDLLDPGDEYFILAFNHRPRVLTGWTNQPDVVTRAPETLRPNGGPAADDRVPPPLPPAARG